MLVTIFLAVLIVALLIGNVFLELTKPKKFGNTPNSPSPSNPNLPNNKIPLLKNNSIPSGILMLQSNVRASSERLNALNRRIESVEKLLLGANNTNFALEKLGNAKVAKKLNGILEFKRNAEIEIMVLKQRLEKIENKENSNTEKELTPSEEEEFEKKIRNIIYHSGRN